MVSSGNVVSMIGDLCKWPKQENWLQCCYQNHQFYQHSQWAALNLVTRSSSIKTNMMLMLWLLKADILFKPKVSMTKLSMKSKLMNKMQKLILSTEVIKKEVHSKMLKIVFKIINNLEYQSSILWVFFKEIIAH